MPPPWGVQPRGQLLELALLPLALTVPPAILVDTMLGPATVRAIADRMKVYNAVAAKLTAVVGLQGQKLIS